MASKVTVGELNAVTSKIAMYVGERVAAQLNAINGTSICAGINGQPELQKKARINHYGGEGTRRTTVRRWETSYTPVRGKKKVVYKTVRMTVPYRIPERHFIDYAISNGMLGSANRNIVSYIQTALKGRARIHENLGGSQQYTKQRESAFAKGIGTTTFWKSLGAKMVENQREALKNTEPNAPSTVKRKGKNEPLRETYGLYWGLEHWTE